MSGVKSPASALLQPCSCFVSALRFHLVAGSAAKVCLDQELKLSKLFQEFVGSIESYGFGDKN